MLARLLTRYPTAILISELLQIHAGKFVVRSEIQVDGITRATRLAAAETLELAEDRARSRSLMVLLPEPSSEMQPEILARPLSGMSEAQPDIKAFLPLAGADNKHTRDFATLPGWNSSTSSFAAVPTVEEATLTSLEF